MGFFEGQQAPPREFPCALQELVNQGQAVVCFGHVSQLQQPCFQSCSPQKSMVRGSCPQEASKGQFVLPPLRPLLSGEAAPGESLEPADSAQSFPVTMEGSGQLPPGYVSARDDKSYSNHIFLCLVPSGCQD